MMNTGLIHIPYDRPTRVARQTFDWARIERAPGRYDLSFYDRYVAALARRHLRLLPILFNPPPFRSSAPPEARGMSCSRV